MRERGRGKDTQGGEDDKRGRDENERIVCR